MERAERDERVELRERRVVDEGGFLEDLAAVQDAVADGVDLERDLRTPTAGSTSFFVTSVSAWAWSRASTASSRFSSPVRA